MANSNHPNDSNDLVDKDEDTDIGDLIGTDHDTETTYSVNNYDLNFSEQMDARSFHSFTDPPPRNYNLHSRILRPRGTQNTTTAPVPRPNLQNPHRAANHSQSGSNPTYTRRRWHSTSGESPVAGPSRPERYNLRRAALSRAAALALSTIEDNTSAPGTQSKQPAADSPTETDPNEEPENPVLANTTFYCTDLAPNADHTLCLPTHPCIWTSPSKAREVHAQRKLWLQNGRSLEETQRADGYFPALTDEFGETKTKTVGALARGQDPKEAYDWFVMERFTAVILPGELGVRVGEEEWEAHWVALGRLLENDEWAD